MLAGATALVRASRPTACRDRVTSTCRQRILFLSWRDLAHPQAGGSEVLVDSLIGGSPT